MESQYDVIVIGTGFAASFFLLAYLERAAPTERILVLERGEHDTHAWQISNRRNSSTDFRDTFINRSPAKSWVYTPAFGGGSNCWWAVTPRMLPNDFTLRSRYGVGADWPIGYDDLEPYYARAEQVMAVSGPADGGPCPRSGPYPQPPHRFTDPDRLLKKAYPDLYFEQPTARASQPTKNRPACCASGVCELCPIDAKFTVLNEMAAVYADPRVTLLLGATVRTVETSAGVATGVVYEREGKVSKAGADLVVLAANAIFNPHLLLSSGFEHPLLGRRLHEQVGVGVTVDLDGIDGFQGSTSMTAHGYMLYDGPHRAERAACLIESFNIPYIRLEPGKWRQRMVFKFVFEDLPDERNYVAPSADDPSMPEVVYHGRSEYAQRGIDSLPAVIPKILESLPVESIAIDKEPGATQYHIQGTTLMGADPEASIVDRALVHHRVRNLLVLGSSVFPTGAPANPSLTIAALSLWAADRLV